MKITEQKLNLMKVREKFVTILYFSFSGETEKSQKLSSHANILKPKLSGWNTLGS